MTAVHVPIGQLEARLSENAARARAEPSVPLDPATLHASRPSDPTGRSLPAILEERAEGW